MRTVGQSLSVAVTACVIGLAACTDAPTVTTSPGPESSPSANDVTPTSASSDPRVPKGVSASFARRFREAPDSVQNRFIVTLRESVRANQVGGYAEELITAFGGHPKYVYTGVLTGF